MRNRNLIITGANGFIGKHLCHYLEKEYNVFALVSKPNRLTFKNPTVLNLRDRKRVTVFTQHFKKKHTVYGIIHLASKLSSFDDIDSSDIFYQNIKITEGIIEMAKFLKPKKIINFSSIAVYPNKEGVYNETSEIKPSANTDCWYGLSKFCGENMLDFTLRKHNIAISHLRISQVYGKGMREDRIIPVMIKELREKNGITVFGDGERVSNFITVDKLLNIIKLFITKDLKGVYNIGGENLSYMDLAGKIIKEYGTEKSKIVKKSVGSKAKFYLDTRKFTDIT